MARGLSTPAKTEIQVCVWPSQGCCTSPCSRKEIHNRLDIQTNLNCDLMAHTVISLQGNVLSINHVNIPFVTPLHVLLNFLRKSWEWSSTGLELREQRERRDVTGNCPFFPLHVTLEGARGSCAVAGKAVTCSGGGTELWNSCPCSYPWILARFQHKIHLHMGWKTIPRALRHRKVSLPYGSAVFILLCALLYLIASSYTSRGLD